MSLDPTQDGENPLEGVKLWDENHNLIHDFGSMDDVDEDDVEDYDPEDDYEEEVGIATGEWVEGRPHFTDVDPGVTNAKEESKDEEDWMDDPKFWDDLEAAILKDQDNG